MHTFLRRCLAASPLLLVLAAHGALAAADPVGIWIDHTGRGAVEISDCSGSLCGRIVWLKAAGDREVCGMQVIGNARAVAGGKWDGGWIYDPEAKSKYDVELTPLSDNKLKVLGYAGSKMFSETMLWTRAPANLERCDQSAAVTPEAKAPAAPDAQRQSAASPPPAASGSEREADPAPTGAIPSRRASRGNARSRSMGLASSPSRAPEGAGDRQGKAISGAILVPCAARASAAMCGARVGCHARRAAQKGTGDEGMGRHARAFPTGCFPFAKHANGTRSGREPAGGKGMVNPGVHGPRGKLAISSTMSMTGHLLGAAGGVGAVVCLQAIADGLPAPIGRTATDPRCDLGYLPHVRRTGRSATPWVAFALGGPNAVLVFAAPPG